MLKPLFFYLFILCCFLLELLATALCKANFLPLVYVGCIICLLQKNFSVPEFLYAVLVLCMSSFIQQTTSPIMILFLIIAMACAAYRTLLQSSFVVWNVVVFFFLMATHIIYPYFEWTIANISASLVIIPVMVWISMRGTKDNRVYT